MTKFRACINSGEACGIHATAKMSSLWDWNTNGSNSGGGHILEGWKEPVQEVSEVGVHGDVSKKPAPQVPHAAVVGYITAEWTLQCRSKINFPMTKRWIMRTAGTTQPTNQSRVDGTCCILWHTVSMVSVQLNFR